jgi:hypothetical protein
MPDLWFFVGVAIGTVVTGFCAIGSFDRGADSVRRRAFSTELFARQRAVTAARAHRPRTFEGAVAKAS